MKRILSLASFVCAILFAAAGMMMPPQGEISGSVLILVAQLLILCATFLGIKDYRDIINRKLSWLKILKTSGASSSTSLWPPSLPFSRLLVSPSDDLLPLANPWTALCGSWVSRVQGSGFQVSWFTVSVSNLTAYSITVFEKQKMGETGYWMGVNQLWRWRMTRAHLHLHSWMFQK